MLGFVAVGGKSSTDPVEVGLGVEEAGMDEDSQSIGSRRAASGSGTIGS